MYIYIYFLNSLMFVAMFDRAFTLVFVPQLRTSTRKLPLHCKIVKANIHFIVIYTYIFVLADKKDRFLFNVKKE